MSREGPEDKRRITHMLNKVTDNAIIKVVHLFPRYALARGDGKNYREQVQDKSPKTPPDPGSLSPIPQRTTRKPSSSERSLVRFLSVSPFLQSLWRIRGVGRKTHGKTQSSSDGESM